MGILKVFSLVKKIIPKDVTQTTNKLLGAVKKGHQISKRCNSIYTPYKMGKVKTTAKSVTKELGKLKFQRDEIPALAASLTYLIPIPSPIPLTPLVYGVGHGINYGLKITGKVFNKIF